MRNSFRGAAVTVVLTLLMCVQAMAAVMTEEGVPYKIKTYDGDNPIEKNVTIRTGDISLLSSILSGNELISAREQLEKNTPDGYEWYLAYIDDIENLSCGVYAEGSYDVVSALNFWGVGSMTPETWGPITNFKIDFNGVTYTECKSWNYGTDSYQMIRADLLPSGFTGDVYVRLKGLRWLKTQTGDDYELICPITFKNTSIFEQTALGWKQDDKGWRVQNADGTYLTSQWHESNGQWYYLGADGYMLTSTTTPDGYQVNADGIWVQ